MDESKMELGNSIIDAMNRIITRLDRMDSRGIELANIGTCLPVQNTTVNTSDKGRLIAVWICAFCCSAMAFMAWSWHEEQIKQAIQVADQNRRLDQANDRLSIVLQWAPHLSREVENEMNQRKGRLP